MVANLAQFSKPLKFEKTKLATVFWLNFRDSKKGRLFIPIYDERFPFVFNLKYSYLSKFLKKDNVSGNHYHKVKQEIIIPIQGKFEVYLMDINTHEKELFIFDGDENKAIYINTFISHKIISLKKTGILLVLASNPSSVKDEIEYKI